jgi:hypothetical protein
VDGNAEEPEVNKKSSCSKWETKLERRCEHCEFFQYDENRNGDCKRSYPNTQGEWPRVSISDWCGEFRGRE